MKVTASTAAYTPVTIRREFRSQAVNVWAVGAAVAAGWVALIAAAPLLRAGGVETFSTPLYHFFGFICHQLPERSLYLYGNQLAVCSRCFGVYFGLLFGIAVYPLWRAVDEIEPLPRIWLFLAMIPIGVDWSLTILGIWTNTHLSRFVTGAILGLACATFILPAAVEIKRNLAIRSTRRK